MNNKISKNTKVTKVLNGILVIERNYEFSELEKKFLKIKEPKEVYNKRA